MISIAMRICHRTTVTFLSILAVLILVWANPVKADRTGTKLVSVMLNEDNDNQNLYPDPAPIVGDHRPFEPVWDMEEPYLNQPTQELTADDDLVKVDLPTMPENTTGEAVLKLGEGSDKVRLWTQNTKGAKQTDGSNEHEIVIPAAGKSYTLATLPASVYVEGMKTGPVQMTLNYTIGNQKQTLLWNIHVVALRIKEEIGQGIKKQRVVYRGRIDFEVEGGPDGEYFWDLDGDDHRGMALSEWDRSRIKNDILYSQYAPDYYTRNRVQLLPGVDKQKEKYKITVEVPGELILERTIRVTVHGYYGTPLTGVTIAERQDEIKSLSTVVGQYDPTPKGDKNQPSSQAWFEDVQGIIRDIDGQPETPNDPAPQPTGEHRLQYAPKFNVPMANAAAWSPGVGPIVALISPAVYSQCQVKEAALFPIHHEERHIAQYIAAKNQQPDNVWYKLGETDLSQKFLDFYEVDGHALILKEGTWYYLWTDSLDKFNTYHDRAEKLVSDSMVASQVDPSPFPDLATRTVCRKLLQDLYKDLPFEEMKKDDSDYDITVRPPK